MTAAKKLVPASAFNLWALVQTARLIGLLPGSVSRTFAKFGGRNLRLHDIVAVKDYSPLQ